MVSPVTPNALRPPPQAAWRLRRSRWLRAGALLIGTAILYVLGLALWLLPQLPSLSTLTHYEPKQALRVFSADGVQIGGFGSERRVYQRIDQIPERMKKSLLAVEDARFYAHGGIDPISVARAVVSITTLGMVRRVQGGSTITQQVARTFLLTRERTLTRKLKEAILSVRIEAALSKDQILELYMNQIYLGARAYGFEAAAHAYFGKTLAQLSIAECAMLAGLPQNPHYVNPIRNPERARARQLVALALMRNHGAITEAEHQAAKAEKLVVRKGVASEVHAEYVAEMVRQQVVAEYGDKAYTLGLDVTTTVVAAEQQAAYQALRRTLIDHTLRQSWSGPEDHETLADELRDDDPAVAQTLATAEDDEDLRAAIVTQASPSAVTAVLASGEVIRVDKNGLRQAQPGLAPKARAALAVRRGSIVRVLQQGKNWVLTQWPQAEGALVAVHPASGAVRALVGGFDFSHNQFNHATQGWRQPGSTFKPFLYAAALDHGVVADTLVNDAPIHIGNWSPSNSDGSEDGPITLQQALARSKNLVTIRLVQLLGATSMRDWVLRFGFERERHPDNLTLALGTGATTPLQLASAYAVFANGGYLMPAHLVQKIATTQGELLFEAPPPTPDKARRVTSARNAFVTASLLQEVTRSGTAARAQASLRRTDLYGKTGTTNEVVDAWFGGFQPERAAVVWIGHDQPRSMGNHQSGASLALPAWIDYMATALKDEPARELSAPEDVLRVDGHWRYAEWALGGALPTLGLDGETISPALIPPPPEAAASAAPALTASAPL